MDAIIAAPLNLEYVMEYVVKDAIWAADLKNIISNNAENGELTYVYTVVRGTGERAKTFYYHMTGTKFNETFVFTNGSSNWATMPIINK